MDILPSWNDVRQTRLSLLRGCQAEQMVKRNLPSGNFVFYLHKPLTNRFLRVNGKQPGKRKPEWLTKTDDNVNISRLVIPASLNNYQVIVMATL